MLSFLLSFEPFSYILPLFFFFSLLHSLSLHYFICVPLFDLPMLIRMHAILYRSLSCTAVISHCELFTFTKVTTWRGFFCLRSWWKFKTTPRSAPKDSPRHTSDSRLYISLLKHALHSGERAQSQNSVYILLLRLYKLGCLSLKFHIIRASEFYLGSALITPHRCYILKGTEASGRMFTEAAADTVTQKWKGGGGRAARIISKRIMAS